LHIFLELLHDLVVHHGGAALALELYKDHVLTLGNAHNFQLNVSLLEDWNELASVLLCLVLRGGLLVDLLAHLYVNSPVGLGDGSIVIQAAAREDLLDLWQLFE